MNITGFTGRRGQSMAAAPRVGLFGYLGSGNIGNDASMESVLRYLNADHPDAILDAMCMGPEKVKGAYGIEAIPLLWYQKHEQAAGVTAIALKALGKGLDAFRTASWVRRHDVVIVPGMGVLEMSLQVWPWGFPYQLFLLCAAGRIFGTKVALVSVGGDRRHQRLTRWLLSSAARLAFYRSYRDAGSRDAMSQRGLDSTQEPIYPDLVFSAPMPPYDPGDAQTVGVGVMAYYGTNDDRGQADQIYASYVEKMKSFVRWLADNDRKVRLLVGDTSDDSVVQEILADLRAHRPKLEASRVVAEPASSFAELTRAMTSVGTMVATRYHNVICALMLARPTLSIGYAAKNDALMADTGMSEFCQSVRSLDVGRLIEQFTELESRSAQLRRTLQERNTAKARLLDDQFATLSAVLFPAGGSARAAAEQLSVQRGAR